LLLFQPVTASLINISVTRRSLSGWWTYHSFCGRPGRFTQQYSCGVLCRHPYHLFWIVSCSMHCLSLGAPPFTWCMTTPQPRQQQSTQQRMMLDIW